MFTVTSKHLVAIVLFFVCGLIGWGATSINSTEKEIVLIRQSNLELKESIEDIKKLHKEELDKLKAQIDTIASEKARVFSEMERLKYDCLNTTVKTIADLKNKVTKMEDKLPKENISQELFPKFELPNIPLPDK